MSTSKSSRRVRNHQIPVARITVPSEPTASVEEPDSYFAISSSTVSMAKLMEYVSNIERDVPEDFPSLRKD